MTNEEKELLLKDLCARLPYKVRCKCVSGLGGGETEKGVLKYVGNCYGVISNYYEGVPLHSGFVNNVFYPIENIKPYLRPMSSMTEEEKNFIRNKYFFEDWINWTDLLHYHYHQMNVEEIVEFMEWIYANHFDLPRKVDGKLMTLVDLGLALEAPEGMYGKEDKK